MGIIFANGRCEKVLESIIKSCTKKGGYLLYRIILFWIPILFLIFFLRKVLLLPLPHEKCFLLLLLVFHVAFFSVLIFNSALEKGKNILRLSMGEMRRSIAIILTIAFISTLFLDLSGCVAATEYTTYFAYGVYGTIMSFYFGFRTAEKKKIAKLIDTKDATKILEMRYALGDLSDGEFRKMQEELGLKEGNYLFSWDNIPGKDNIKLLRFLMDNLHNDWKKSVEIEKSNDKTIVITIDGKRAEIVMEDEKKKASLTIDGKTCNLKVKSENGKLEIYEE